jgi:hypothetical protein
MTAKRLGLLLATLTLAGCSSTSPQASAADLRQQVVETERAFARTMATRDHAAFVSFLSISREPEEVAVLDSGTLAPSSGPVRDPAGNLVRAFTSIWRLENGRWRIVFDKGNEACPKAP